MGQHSLDPDIAYFAGYIDGEGSFGWYNGARVCVVNTYPGTLKDFQARWGGAIDTRKRESADSRFRQQFSWRVYGENALRVCRDIMPYLFEKRRQARLLLAIAEQPKGEFRDGLIQELKDSKRVNHTQ